MFVIKYQRFHKDNPHEHSRFLFILCGIINLVVYFQVEAKNENQFLFHKNSPKLLISLEKCDKTSFGQTLYGKIGFQISIIISTILPLVIEIGISFISLKYLTKYLKHKKDFIHRRNQTQNQYDMWQFNDNDDQVYELSVIDHQNQTDMNKQIELAEFIHELNTNMTQLIIFLNIFSVFCNCVSLIIVFVLTLMNDNVVMFSYIVILYDFFTLSKNGSIFFLFILFNKSFRRYLFKC